jgi:hypothetical protein
MKVIAKLPAVPVYPVDEVTITLSGQEAQYLLTLTSRAFNKTSRAFNNYNYGDGSMSLSGCGSVTSTLVRELKALGFKGEEHI